MISPKPEAPISQDLDFQPYNSQRPDLTIPEYGRHVQKMVMYAATIADREERNKCVRAIISVMGQLFPQLRDIEDYNHKLWDHLQIMSGFTLDVDSPYPLPSPESLRKKPDPVPYPSGNIRFGHYGRYVERMIDKCSDMEDGEGKEAFKFAIANVMKYNSINWNRSHVTDDVIFNDLKILSKGNLQIEGAAELIKVQPAAIQNKFDDFDSFNAGLRKKNNNNNKNKKKGKNKKFGGKGFH
ncbi:MAG: DUF4290 domain-containing protein [Flavobacteriales bacterium]|nr:DUF4290 domain-containing protein [Flavobacteriales bacterium]